MSAIANYAARLMRGRDDLVLSLVADFNALALAHNEVQARIDAGNIDQNADILGYIAGKQITQQDIQRYSQIYRRNKLSQLPSRTSQKVQQILFPSDDCSLSELFREALEEARSDPALPQVIAETLVGARQCHTRLIDRAEAAAQNGERDIGSDILVEHQRIVSELWGYAPPDERPDQRKCKSTQVLNTNESSSQSAQAGDAPAMSLGALPKYLTLEEIGVLCGGGKRWARERSRKDQLGPPDKPHSGQSPDKWLETNPFVVEFIKTHGPLSVHLKASK